jgi:amidase
MADLRSLDATAMVQAMDAKRISALEFLDASIAQAHKLKAPVNAVVAEDPEPARAAARAIDDRRAKGETSETLGLLAGLPMTIKDTFDVTGMPASSGLKAYLGRAAGDAAAVGRARTEGAVIWGKTNVPVLAGDWQSFNALYGTTNNPWDVERTPGGSSGGAAAALAAGITPLEIGSDIGGSLRIPASFCGVFSHKPTYGLVSQRGHVPPKPGSAAEADLNVIGPMARSARDLRLLLSVLANGPVPAKAAPAALNGLKVALWLEEPAFILDAEVRLTVEAFVADLASAGAVVDPVASPVDAEALLDVYLQLLYPIIAADFPPAQRRSLELLRGPAKWFGGRANWARLALAATLSHRDWLIANERRAQMGRAMRRFFERYDVLIAPIAPVTAFPHDHRPFARRKLICSDGRKIPYDAMLRWIALATCCGLPATAVPVGLSQRGLPVGVQIIGLRGGDSKTLAVAQAIEAALGGFRAPQLDWTT